MDLLSKYIRNSLCIIYSVKSKLSLNCCLPPKQDKEVRESSLFRFKLPRLSLIKHQFVIFSDTQMQLIVAYSLPGQLRAGWRGGVRKWDTLGYGYLHNETASFGETRCEWINKMIRVLVTYTAFNNHTTLKYTHSIMLCKYLPPSHQRCWMPELWTWKSNLEYELQFIQVRHVQLDKLDSGHGHANNVYRTNNRLLHWGPSRFVGAGRTDMTYEIISSVLSTTGGVFQNSPLKAHVRVL